MLKVYDHKGVNKQSSKFNFSWLICRSFFDVRFANDQSSTLNQGWTFNPKPASRTISQTRIFMLKDKRFKFCIQQSQALNKVCDVRFADDTLTIINMPKDNPFIFCEQKSSTPNKIFDARFADDQSSALNKVCDVRFADDLPNPNLYAKR